VILISIVSERELDIVDDEHYSDETAGIKKKTSSKYKNIQNSKLKHYIPQQQRLRNFYGTKT